MFNKVTYTEGVTLIHAENLNDIQDAIIEDDGNIADLQSDVDGLQTDVGGLQSDVSDIQAQTVFTTPQADGTYVLKVTVADGEATYEWVEEETEPEVNNNEGEN